MQGTRAITIRVWRALQAVWNAPCVEFVHGFDECVLQAHTDELGWQEKRLRGHARARTCYKQVDVFIADVCVCVRLACTLAFSYVAHAVDAFAP